MFQHTSTGHKLGLSGPHPREQGRMRVGSGPGRGLGAAGGPGAAGAGQAGRSPHAPPPWCVARPSFPFLLSWGPGHG